MGKPSPEGIHQDGEEYFGVLLINRYNISGGKSIIYDLNENILNEFELVKPGDSYIVSDKLVKHSVTPIEVIDASDIGFRDVLIINYRVYTDDLL